jgi:hypothetical protein
MMLLIAALSVLSFPLSKFNQIKENFCLRCETINPQQRDDEKFSKRKNGGEQQPRNLTNQNILLLNATMSFSFLVSGSLFLPSKQK